MAEFEKMDLASTDLVAERIEQLKQLLPEIATEGGIDFDKLRLVLGDDVDEGTERYAFTWPGKTDAIRQSQTPSTATLRPCPEESVNWDETENLYIEGDNLEVLKLLQHSYHGRVKLIYIDPPYNTGQDFIYTDTFEDTINNYRHQTTSECQSNPDTSGRFHTRWCNLMYPRLKLAKELLADDGAIFISIDDGELTNLKKICDEIFGETRFVNLVAVKSKNSSGASGGGEDKKLKKNLEYLLIYGGPKFQRFNPTDALESLGEFLDRMKADGISFKYTSVFQDFGERRYIGSTVDGAGSEIKVYEHEGYRTCGLASLRSDDCPTDADVIRKYIDRVFTTENAQTSIRTRVQNHVGGRDGLYSIEYVPVSGRDKGKITTKYFIGDKQRLVSWFKDVCVIDGDGNVFKRERAGTLWDKLNWNNVSHEGDLPFPNGKKALSFVMQILNLGTACDDEDDIVLDFFSGSATTAHAVFACNAQDGGTRRFIMVQLPEINDKASLKANSGYKNICEIGKERIRRAGAKIAAEVEEANRQLHLGEEPKPVPDIGFRVLKLDESGIERPKPGELLLDVVKPDRSDEDIIFEMMLKWGLELTLPIEKVDAAGYPCYSVAYGELICCLADGLNMQVLDAIADMEPRRVLMLDRILDDTTKLNAVQAFKRVEEKTGIEVELRTV